MKKVSLIILISLCSIAGIASEEVRQLTHGGGEAYGSISPQFDPDGKRIVFASCMNETYHIWTMNTNGENLKEITRLAWDMSPTWSPDGNIVAFNSYGDQRSDSFSIWMVDLVNGKTWKFITASPNGDQHPCWSPDGKEIVWTHSNQLWIAPAADSSQAKPLTAPIQSNSHYEYCGGWSPDGLWIAYLASDEYFPYCIWMIRRDGKEQRKLFNGIQANQLKWAGDGKSLYFSNDQSLMLLDLNDGAQTKLFDWPNSNNDFDISPDEKWFIFDNSGDNESGNLFIRSVEVH